MRNLAVGNCDTQVALPTITRILNYVRTTGAAACYFVDYTSVVTSIP